MVEPVTAVGLTEKGDVIYDSLNKLSRNGYATVPKTDITSRNININRRQNRWLMGTGQEVGPEPETANRVEVRDKANNWQDQYEARADQIPSQTDVKEVVE